MTKSPEVWILTREINEYNQDGKYFVAAFNGKPTIQRLAEVFGYCGKENTRALNVMSAIAFLEHVLQGGGRQGTEDEWYHLEKVDLK